MSEFLTKFNGAQINRRLWSLSSDLLFQDSERGELFVVPQGFETNLASIDAVRYLAPLLYAVLAGYGNASCALHDYLYTEGRLPRAECDRVLYRALIAEGVGNWRAWLFWSGVRMFGERNYNQSE